MEWLKREYWDVSTRTRRTCCLRTSVDGSDAVVEVSVEDEPARAHRGGDYEDALQALREDFESLGRLVLVNRFRRDALVSSMSRQASGGLSCYLVKPGRPVGPALLVVGLDAADVDEVVFEQEATAFIARWKSEGPGLRFPWPRWLTGRGW